jgi:intracellular septation protein A
MSEDLLHVRLPSLMGAARHASSSLIEGALVPLGLFYGCLTVFGFRAAIVAALAWSLAVFALRLVRRQRPSAILVLGTVFLILRTAVSFASGSAFLYFVQPSAASILTALIFVGSAIVRRPIVERMARELCPLEPELFQRPAVRRFFVQISLLWAAVLLSNAAISIWLLVSTSLRDFVLERTAASYGLTAAAIVASAVWFHHSMRRDGVKVSWGRHPAG